MSETVPPKKLRLREFEELRDKFRSQKESNPDPFAPPKPWNTQLYEDEYKPLPKVVKFAIKSIIIAVALSIAIDYGTRHTRSFLCQWGWGSTKFCETTQSNDSTPQ